MMQTREAKKRAELYVGLTRVVVIIVGGIIAWSAISPDLQRDAARSEAESAAFQRAMTADNATPPEPEHKPNGAVDVSIGSNGILFTGAGVVDIAVNRAALDELVKAAAAKDNDGYRQVISEGRAFQVHDGTRAKLIGVGGLFFDQYCHVRVLQGLYAGKDGWVPSEWLRRG